VSARPQWSYVQARLQARHGERLDEEAWRSLEASKSIAQFMERSRATALRRFTEALMPAMSSHAIERILRAAWRTYVAQIATWVAPAWRPAVLWATVVPELPAIDALLKGEAPEWAREEPYLSPFAEADPQRRAADLGRSSFAPLVAPGARTLAERWFAHWRASWPGPSAADRRLLTDLVRAIARHWEQLGGAAAHEASGPYRRNLARDVTRLFRHSSGRPAAVFCHLALVALDLERLRGGLVRRRLFEPARVAA